MSSPESGPGNPNGQLEPEVVEETPKKPEPLPEAVESSGPGNPQGQDRT